jgi:hypothetical protein
VGNDEREEYERRERRAGNDARSMLVEPEHARCSMPASSNLLVLMLVRR